MKNEDCRRLLPTLSAVAASALASMATRRGVILIDDRRGRGYQPVGPVKKIHAPGPHPGIALGEPMAEALVGGKWVPASLVGQTRSRKRTHVRLQDGTVVAKRFREVRAAKDG